MAWTHNVTGVENSGDKVRVLVAYTDGAATVHDGYETNSPSVDLDWLRAKIVQKLSELEALAAFAASVETGAIDLTLPTPPTLPTPELPIIELTPFSQSSFRFDGDGVAGTCTAGQTLTLDYLIDPTYHPLGQKIDGGMVIVSGGKVGDYITCSVVDAGNILPSPYTGATLDTWVVKWYMPENGYIQLSTPYAGLIPDGFYLRIVYHSTGTTDVSVAMNYRLHSPIP